MELTRRRAENADVPLVGETDGTVAVVQNVVNANQRQACFLPQLPLRALLRRLAQVYQASRKIVDPLGHRHTVLPADQDTLAALVRQNQDDGIRRLVLQFLQRLDIPVPADHFIGLPMPFGCHIIHIITGNKLSLVDFPNAFVVHVKYHLHKLEFFAVTIRRYTSFELLPK